MTTQRSDRLPPGTYRRRRAVAAATLCTVALAGGGVAADGVLRDSGGVPASAAGAALPPLRERTVVARPGDTLWALARQHHGVADFDRYLDEVIDLNGGTAIQVGQIVRLP
jgi:hypothetical protein